MLTSAFPRAGLLHARPASVVAAAARNYESVVMVCMGTAIADAKDPVALMRLGCTDGTSLELMADGPDEAAALRAVLEAMTSAFA